jgi:aminopeptidase N
MNPQIAARMVKPFSDWRRYDNGRQHLMRETLERILQHKTLSKDVFEIVSKSLKNQEMMA